MGLWTFPCEGETVQGSEGREEASDTLSLFSQGLQEEFYLICFCPYISMRIEVGKAKMIKNYWRWKHTHSRSRLESLSPTQSVCVPSMLCWIGFCQLAPSCLICPKAGKEISFCLMPSQWLCISSLMRGSCRGLAGTGEARPIILRRLCESQGWSHMAVAADLCRSSHFTVFLMVRPVASVNSTSSTSSGGTDCFSDPLRLFLQTDLHFPASPSFR